MTDIRESRSSNRFSIGEVASVISGAAHVIERSGLAIAGALCGLFVAALLLRAKIDRFDSVSLGSAMMLFGLVGFYLGIDTPPAPSRASRLEILNARVGQKLNSSKCLSLPEHSLPPPQHWFRCMSLCLTKICP
jgi:hypothetical protein